MDKAEFQKLKAEFIQATSDIKKLVDRDRRRVKRAKSRDA